MTLSATCPACQQPQHHGILCHNCCQRLEQQLRGIPSLMADLDIALSKMARIGNNGGGSGLARERAPIDLGAMQAADNLTNTLTTWARDIMQGGFEPKHPCPAKAAAAVLLFHIDAVRRHNEAAKLVDEISDTTAQARHAIDRPAERVYLGQCMAETPDQDGRQVTCLEDLYARLNAAEVVCRVCATEHPVAERRAWLLQQARDRLFTVREAAQMVGAVGGITVTEAAIRGYIHRKQRLAYRPGTKLIRLGDLLAVVLDDHERKTA